MRLDPDDREAFLDWLEREQIQRSLIAGRSELEHQLILEDDRPLIRIPTSGGCFLLVAKVSEGPDTQWVVGVPGNPEPTIHDTASCAEVVRIVLEELSDPDFSPGDAS